MTLNGWILSRIWCTVFSTSTTSAVNVRLSQLTLTHLVSRADAPVSILNHLPVNEAHDGVLRAANAAADTRIQHLQARHVSAV